MNLVLVIFMATFLIVLLLRRKRAGFRSRLRSDPMFWRRPGMRRRRQLVGGRLRWMNDFIF